MPDGTRVVLWDERAEFAPSPRPEPPVSAAFANAVRGLGESAACIRRAGSSTRAYVRCDHRAWRWLFLSPRLPAGEE